MIETKDVVYKVNMWFEPEIVPHVPPVPDTPDSLFRVLLPDYWNEIDTYEQESYVLGLLWENTEVEYDILTQDEIGAFAVLDSDVVWCRVLLTLCSDVHEFKAVPFPTTADWNTLSDEEKDEWISNCIWDYSRQKAYPIIYRKP